MTTLEQSTIDAIARAEHGDIFSVLGPHGLSAKRSCVRGFFPGASAMQVCAKKDGKVLASGELLHPDGVFEARINRAQPPEYYLTLSYDGETVDCEDPYRFPSTIGEQDIYLYGEGTHEQAYNFLGAHLIEIDGVPGCRFAVWAPNARRVSVVGDFNFWDGRPHVMRRHSPAGIWEIFIPYVGPGSLYKFEIVAADGRLLPQKADPFAFFCEPAPGKASRVVQRNTYTWRDELWPEKAAEINRRDQPISIYEVHAGSWRRKGGNGEHYLSWRELAETLIPYVQEMGFTHIQLMPVSEYPFDGSWGYQPTGLYAPTSRFGTPDDFKYFVDRAHLAGVAVLIDWVPGHFPTDDHGLGRFDGTPLYEHADARLGFHPDWNTYIYNYGRHEVRNFLIANALFWLQEFHIDGLRVDAVASMLYLDYSREQGEWLPNRQGGRENLEAIDFLRRVNELVYGRFPHVMMVAEESTAWPGVSAPTVHGGLGFGYKWNMGWMNDSLAYMAHEPIHRQYHHHDMTFSLHYAFSENFILPLSHDEVVHGKRSMIGKMPGDCWQQFANLRAYYTFMWAHPGKKLLFMGNEFAQGPEWNHDISLHWHLLDNPLHAGIQKLIRQLNELYLSSPALYQGDALPEGFEWIAADDQHNSVFAFMRKPVSGRGTTVLVVANFTPIPREAYRLGVPDEGFYREIFNSDSEWYGGSNIGNHGGVTTEPVSCHQRSHSLSLMLPPLATLVLQAGD